MGGRGSLYMNFYNPHDTGDDLDFISASAEFDLDTEKEYNGKTAKLKEKHIHIKQSTDNLPEEIFKPNVNKIDHLSRKYLDTAELLKNTDKELAIRSAKMKQSTRACYLFNNTEFNDVEIILNNDIQKTNRKNLENSVQNVINTGHWVSVDKSELVNKSITHEFGHHVQRVLMELDKQTPDGEEKYNKLLTDLYTAKSNKDRELISSEYAENYATQYFKEIQRIERKQFNHTTTADMLSGYSKKSNMEAFAELFAKTNCNKQKDTLSQAMDIFLNKKMTVKGKPI